MNIDPGTQDVLEQLIRLAESNVVGPALKSAADPLKSHVANTAARVILGSFRIMAHLRRSERARAPIPLDPAKPFSGQCQRFIEAIPALRNVISLQNGIITFNPAIDDRSRAEIEKFVEGKYVPEMTMAISPTPWSPPVDGGSS